MSDRTLRELVGEYEKDLILKALEEAQGNQSLTARRLGVSRGKLIYKLKEYAKTV